MTGAWGPTVREAAASDLDTVLGLYPLLFEAPGAPPPDWNEADAAERLSATWSGERSTILVADSGGAIAGFCSAYLDIDSVRYGQRCWVEDLVVAADRRSLGIGAALLRAARRWAGEHGATHLELDSGHGRVDAHRFYDREDPDWGGLTYSWRIEQ